MPVQERISQVIESWSQQIGLVRPTDPAAAAVLDSGPKADARRYEQLQRLTGIAHVQERFDRLAASVDEITAYARPATRGPPGATLGDADQAVVAKSTKCQTLLVRLHRELSEAADALERAQGIPPALGARPGPRDAGVGGFQTLDGPGARWHVGVGDRAPHAVDAARLAARVCGARANEARVAGGPDRGGAGRQGLGAVALLLCGGLLRWRGFWGTGVSALALLLSGGGRGSEPGSNSP